ncbi:unnamed protein product [Didymodactylos carnosus]|uniref:Uncharacterized protein n=1 Tax=Didymodactylos carnosus TaxID=1234261 RepID=A0A8S2XA79_9BILA|nr:unnamed protein product [Didymodactylos carnosus]CAF3984817.1 unnamed protein product [Didymodactylos carnosus]CAF4486534.1 unnamed protein product [Didymodactylos carnosus]
MSVLYPDHDVDEGFVVTSKSPLYIVLLLYYSPMARRINETILDEEFAAILDERQSEPPILVGDMTDVFTKIYMNLVTQ